MSSYRNVTAIQNPNGNSTSYEYDDLRRLTKVTAPSPLSYQTKFTYDKNGNRTKIERETGDVSNPWQTSTATYAIDDLLLTVIDPGSQTTSFDYTALRQLWKTTDAASRVTTRTYDENGHILTVVDNASIVQVTNTYTDNGLLETVNDGEGNETEYQYDGFDRLKKKIYPNTKYEELSYDANSRLTSVRTRNADDIYFSYDVLGRLTQKVPDGMPTVSYEYDLAGRTTKVSTSVVSGNPASGDFDYYYDTAGRLTKEEWPDNNSVQYEYDEVGNVTKVTYPDSYYVERVFDEINRLTGIKLNGATALALEFEYDKLSRRTKLTYENGVETDYGFQLDNDMESLLQTFTGSSVEFSYGFNSVHELTSQSVDDSAYMWHPASGGTVTYGSANNMNQYPTVAGNSISYDDNGCLTDDGTFAFTYDTENQLIEADDGSTVSSYIYDPMRRQNQKDVGGTKTRYLYNGMRMIAEYDGSGTLQKKYVYGPGLDEVLIELDSSNNKTYLHHDSKGSIIAISNGSGVVVNSLAYSPFGESGSLSGTTFGYTGQRFDPETGLYYYKNRYYSPQIGRFLQPDPIGYKDGLNLYCYAHNDPIQFSDPLGLAAGGGGSYSPDTDFIESTRKFHAAIEVITGNQYADRAPRVYNHLVLPGWKPGNLGLVELNPLGLVNLIGSYIKAQLTAGDNADIWWLPGQDTAIVSSRPEYNIFMNIVRHELATGYLMIYGYLNIPISADAAVDLGIAYELKTIFIDNLIKSGKWLPYLADNQIDVVNDRAGARRASDWLKKTDNKEDAWAGFVGEVFREAYSDAKAGIPVDTKGV